MLGKSGDLSSQRHPVTKLSLGQGSSFDRKNVDFGTLSFPKRFHIWETATIMASIVCAEEAAIPLHSKAQALKTESLGSDLPSTTYCRSLLDK